MKLRQFKLILCTQKIVKVKRKIIEIQAKLSNFLYMLQLKFGADIDAISFFHFTFFMKLSFCFSSVVLGTLF
jgi:hypothetical protein